MRLWTVTTVGLAVTFFGCGDYKEASAEFDAVKLPILLRAIQPLIQKGFGEAQFGQIEDGFRAVAVNESKQLTFPIVYGCVEKELHVLVRKEDVDVIEIRFRSTPALAEQIQRTMRTTPLD